MRSVIRLAVLSALAVLALPATSSAQGIILPGGGGAHLSMGGVSTANPVDAIGALYWNPAGIGRYGRSEAAIGGLFLFPDIHLDASGPPRLGGVSGRTRSDSGAGSALSLGVIYQPEERPPLTLGMGLTTLGGGGVNFPGTTTNPLLSGVGLLGNVQGPIASNIIVLQMTPTVAYKVTDRLVFGLGPTIDLAVTSFDPAYFGASDDANGDGIGTFPTASHSRPFWGGGVRGGFVYSVTEKLDVGFGYTSPQWFEVWRYHARDELGRPRELFLKATLPAIFSLGVAYQATERLLLATDLRYFDYASTKLFGTPVVNGGLGWQSVFAVAVGGRYQLTERASLSGGYIYNDNPIPSVGTLFNVQGPAITKHTITLGTTMKVTEALSMSLGYALSMRNTITGPIRESRGVGAILDTQVHMLTFTMQFRFGGCGCGRKSSAPADSDCAPSTPTASYPTTSGQDSRTGG